MIESVPTPASARPNAMITTISALIRPASDMRPSRRVSDARTYALGDFSM